MGRISRFLIILVVILIFAAAGLFVASQEIPAPVSHVEKVIPNDRFLP